MKASALLLACPSRASARLWPGRVWGLRIESTAFSIEIGRFVETIFVSSARWLDAAPFGWGRLQAWPSRLDSVVGVGVVMLSPAVATFPTHNPRPHCGSPQTGSGPFWHAIGRRGGAC